MHSYLKAIGFSDISEKKELDVRLQDVIQYYDEKKQEMEGIDLMQKNRQILKQMETLL